MGVEPDDESSPAADEPPEEPAEEPPEQTLDPEALADRLDADAVSFVDDLNAAVTAVLDDAPELQFDYVVGDVSSAGVSASGHLHFDLDHGDASVHCVVFQYRLSAIEPEIEDGLQVAVKGDLSYHEPEGQVSVIVSDVVALGAGVYERTYRENRRKLAEDGLLDDEAKQQLPSFPRRIGIATSADSDAREDAVTSVHERYPDVDVVIADTGVQGEDAMASMMRAISELDEDAAVDVIVLTRGGGADTHLRVFNETPLCRVIARTDTPIVVGVGHETDRTLAGEVADRRVRTPTHVGEIVPEKERVAADVDALGDRLEAAYARTARERLDELAADLEAAYEHRVSSQLATTAMDLDHAFETVATERLTALDGRLDHALARCEQRHEHERERDAVAREYERTRRRQRLVIAALALLVLLLLGYVLL